jgi:hypothetical protein
MSEPKPVYHAVETIDGRVALSTSGTILGHEGDDRQEFRARLVRAGIITRADGSQGNINIPADVLSTAVQLGQFEGIASFADHPGFFQGPEVKDLIGLVHSTSFNDSTQSVDGIIKFYNSEDNPIANAVADTLNMMLDDSDEGLPMPDVGISIVFWAKWKPRDNFDEPRELASFRKIDSADVVFGPAADGRILEALSVYAQQGGITMPEQLTLEPAVDEPEDGNQPAPERYTVVAEPGEAAESVAKRTVEMLTSDREERTARIMTQAEEWLDYSFGQAAEQGIRASGLPDIAQDRLRGRAFDNPTELQAAIEDEREYLGQITASQVVKLPGGPPRVEGMPTGLEQMGSAVDWAFGVKDAAIPPPQLRKFDNLYTIMTGDYDFHGTFHPDRVQLASATTGALANLAADALNKVIMEQFSVLTHWRWYERIVAVTPNNGSVQDMQWSTFGGVVNLSNVAEGGAYGELTVDDVNEADAFVKRGDYVGITLEMMKNSDLARMQAVPRALAVAAVRTRSAQVSDLFTSNSGVGPTLDQDATALFHANHNNVATTDFGTDAVAWRAARVEAFDHTEVNSGKALAVFPRFWIGPADIYDQALTTFGYGEGMPTTYTPEAQSRGFEDPRPIPLVSPDFTDANDWAYIVDPQVYPVIHMSYAQAPGSSGQSHPPPEVFTVTSPTGGLMFTNDVMPIKIRDWYAVGVNGPRGIGKRNVA